MDSMTGNPSGCVAVLFGSRSVGIRPFGFILRNQSSFCSFLLMSMACVSYSNEGLSALISSSMIDTFWPLGVPAV